MPDEQISAEEATEIMRVLRIAFPATAAWVQEAIDAARTRREIVFRENG